MDFMVEWQEQYPKSERTYNISYILRFTHKKPHKVRKKFTDEGHRCYRNVLLFKNFLFSVNVKFRFFFVISCLITTTVFLKTENIHLIRRRIVNKLQ